MKRLLLLFVTCAAIHASLACTCIQPSIRQALRHTEVILTGTIISEVPVTLYDSTINFDYPGEYFVMRYQLVVGHVFKGNISQDTVEVFTENGGIDCGFHFAVGQDYILYGSSEYFPDSPGSFPQGPNVIWTALCTRTTPFNQRELRKIRRYFWWRKFTRFLR